MIALDAAEAVATLLVLVAGGALAVRLLRLHGRMIESTERLEAALVAPASPRAAPPLASPPAPAVVASVPAPSLAPPLPAAGAVATGPAPRQPLHPGTPAPAFALPEIQGGPIALSQLGGRPLLLIFFDPNCNFGTRLVPDLLYGSSNGLDGRPLPVVVGEGGFEQVHRLFLDNGVRTPVFHDADGAVAAAYGVEGTPAGYQIDESGRIASELLVGVDAILGPLRPHRAGGNITAQQPPQPGTPAPGFRLPRLGGGELALEQFRGRRLLLVFVDPSCEPCHAVAPELEALHRTSTRTRVALIGRGGAPAMQAMVAECGLSMPVALQQRWEVSRAYGSLSTPLGILVDESGAVAQPAHTGLVALRVALAGLR